MRGVQEVMGEGGTTAVTQTASSIEAEILFLFYIQTTIVIIFVY